MGGKFRVRHVNDDVVEIGIKGTEHYDAEAGELRYTAQIGVDELQQALKDAKKDHVERKAEIKAAGGDAGTGDPIGFAPRYDAGDVRADSSPRSQDRPPIYVSSESNPSEANPLPVVSSSETERLPGGLADVIGNRNFDDAPGPNEAEPPKGVTQPEPDPEAIKAADEARGTEVGLTALGPSVLEENPDAEPSKEGAKRAAPRSTSRRNRPSRSKAAKAARAAAANG